MSSASGWRLGDLTAISGAPKENFFGLQSAYVRGDGVNAVVFGGGDGHIYEMALTPSGWRSGDLTLAAGLPANMFSGAASAYVRADGVSAVLYQGGLNVNGIHETAFVGSRWIDNDLSAVAHAPDLPEGNPNGYVRSDGVNAVVYRGRNGHVEEISLASGGSWTWNDLTLAAGGSNPTSTFEPQPYVRADGVNAVLFPASDGFHELSLAKGGSWQDNNLQAAAQAPPLDFVAGTVIAPKGYVRADGITAVVYRSSRPDKGPLGGFVHDITELALVGGSWVSNNLTLRLNAPGCSPVTTGPTPYVRSDGVSAVVYLDNTFHVQELSLSASGWAVNDLTSLAGGP